VDSEEFEQIPWSSLVADQHQPVDRRLYLAIGVVAVVIAAVFGARLFGGTTPQPLPPEVVLPQVITDVEETTSTSGMVVSEADLMAEAPIDRLGDRLDVIAFAEWFVTDYYTTDGSPETARTLISLFASSAGNPQLPHSASPPPPVTYVEWARSSERRPVGDSDFEVDVVFRTITDSEEGFIRDPVRAVTVTVRTSGSDPGITGPPVEIAVPALGG